MTDELRESIVDPVDLVLYDEARHCLEAGADRAAFIMSWIAAAEGMLGKLRTMAALHGALGTFVGSFEAAQKAGTAKDAELIEKSNEIGLISRVERIELDAMRNLRNQYGHPTATSPDHQSAENALRVAVRYVLAKPALLMHGAVKDLAGRASTDRHYLPSDKTAIRGFVKARASVIHRDARPLFIQELLAGAERQLQDVNGELLAERCLTMASTALEEWSEALDPPRWEIDKLQQLVPSSAGYVFSNPAIWQRLPDEDQDRILSRCLDEPTGALFSRDPGRTRFTWKAAGINAVGRTRWLDQSYRNTREILEFAHNFVMAGGGFEISADPDPDSAVAITAPKFSPRTGPIPVVLGSPSRQGEVLSMAKHVTSLLENRAEPGDIAILYGVRWTGNFNWPESIRIVFSEQGIPIFWANDPDHPGHRDHIGEDRTKVLVSTIHAAKGLEFRHVLLCGYLDDRPPEQSRISRSYP